MLKKDNYTESNINQTPVRTFYPADEELVMYVGVYTNVRHAYFLNNKP